MLDVPTDVDTYLEIVELIPSKELAYFVDLLHDITTHMACGTIDRKTLHDVIRRRADRVLGLFWIERIEKPFLYNGKFEQFGGHGLSVILRLRRPKITKFSAFQVKIENLNLRHPIKDAMLHLLSVMTPFVVMVDQLTELLDGSGRKS